MQVCEYVSMQVCKYARMLILGLKKGDQERKCNQTKTKNQNQEPKLRTKKKREPKPFFQIILRSKRSKKGYWGQPTKGNMTKHKDDQKQTFFK